MKSTTSSLVVCFSGEYAGHVVVLAGAYTTGTYATSWVSAEDTDTWKPFSLPTTETLYEWICVDGGDWVVYGLLLTEEEAKQHFTGQDITKYQKTGRKFKVEIT